MEEELVEVADEPIQEEAVAAAEEELLEVADEPVQEEAVAASEEEQV